MQRALITGGAGFIGSTLADRLLQDGVEVAILDDFRTGRRRVHRRRARARRRAVRGRRPRRRVLRAAVEGCDTVFHLQANADVRHGLEHPRRDLEQNTIATANVLEAMRAAGRAADLLLLDGLGLRRRPM